MNPISMPDAASMVLVVPGSIEQRTGGFLYDARLVRELRALGVTVRVIELAGDWPAPDETARRGAAERLGALPDGSLVMIDALAGSVLPDLLHALRDRLRLIALVHHPLALESGLEPAEAARLARDERRALAAARHVVCTSRSTAGALLDYDVPDGAITVAEPGTDPAPLADGGAAHEAGGGDAHAPFRLLCVATITPRKAHGVLIEALAALRARRPRLHWQLSLVGSLERSPDTGRALRAAIVARGLDRFITLHGELDRPALDRQYARSDVFVLASRHEGYGMVLAEALARGLPIVATRGGAIEDTVPAEAGLLVDVDDVDGLSAALESVLHDRERRDGLRAGAAAARLRLPCWSDTARRVERVLDTLAGAPPSAPEAVR